MNKLVIVESPTKAKTISKFIGKNFEIIATMGHIRDLPKSKFGIEIKKANSHFEFIPEYVIDSKKKAVVEKLLEKAKSAKIILLATDPDREGEAIAYHVKETINSQFVIRNVKFLRVVFHEITKQAIEKAVESPRTIDKNLVDAQQARRLLDRLVGYSLSPLLWKKVKRGLSAGRVQSVAVRLIVEREKEIEKFKSEPYFRIFAAFEKDGKDFIAELVKIDGKPAELSETIKLFDGKYKIAKTIFETLQNAEKVVAGLSENFTICNLKSKNILRRPFPPFTTSTLQQTAAAKFGWPAKQTMKIAQSLFEKGHITYHRTDSLALSGQAIGAIRNLIETNFGKNYLPEKAIFYKTRSKNAQEAHEAIRPTKFKDWKLQTANLEKKEALLYQLIWQRAIASQMAPAKIAQTKIELANNYLLFSVSGSHLLFDGFAKVYPVKFSENDLPPLKEGEIISSQSLGITEHATQPPPRYNEASLIKALEANGIGRPSTYATIISTIQKRLYVEKEQGKFFPTNIGKATNDFLVAHFQKIVDLPFTALVEDKLDDIARGSKKWQPVLANFWRPFANDLKKTEKNAKKIKVLPEKIGKKCPECKTGELVVRIGRFGKFVACSRFPECKYKENHKEIADFVCPKCQSEVLIKKTRRGAKFFACSQWPKCSWSSWKKPRS